MLRVLALLSLLCSPMAFAKGYLAILIDDVGDNEERGLAVLNLPLPVNVAIIPYRPFSHSLALAAHQKQRDVLLHMPMSNTLGTYSSEGLLTPTMSRQAFLNTARKNLAAVPGIVGINNHMGSEMTQYYAPMRWLMQELYSRNLFFIDSRTTTQTQAEAAARDTGITNDRRSVFLDNDADDDLINQQLNRAIALSKEQGFVIAIGHPRPNTIAVLKKRLGNWQEEGVAIVSLTQYMTLRQEKGL